MNKLRLTQNTQNKWLKVLVLIPMFLFGTLLNAQTDSTYFNFQEGVFFDCDSSHLVISNASNYSSTVYYDWNISGLSQYTNYINFSNVTVVNYLSGPYLITLYVYSDAALTSLVDSFSQTINLNYGLFTQSNSYIDYSIQGTCDSSTYQFSLNSPSLVNSWEWEIAGQIYGDEHPSITLANDGSYDVAYLTASNGYCSENFTFTFFVPFDSCLFITPNVFYTQLGITSCYGADVLFNSQPTGGVAPYLYEWSYNGIVYYGSSPILEMYDYNPVVTLTVTDASGATVTEDINVYVNSYGVEIYESIISQTCDSTTVQYDALSNYLVSNWNWEIGPYTSHIPNPIFTFANDGSTISASLYPPNSFCLDTTFSYLDLETNSCNPTIESCIYTLTLFDSYGDGWNGNSLNTFVNGVLYNNYTMSGANASLQSFNIPLNSNDSISFQWNNIGLYQDECSWDFKTSYNTSVFNEASPLSTLTVGPYVTNCNNDSTGCGHILTLDDTFGDGWNGNSLNAYVNGVFYNNYTLTTGNTQNFPLSLNTGDQISFEWDDSGMWSQECSWHFTNSSGNLVLNEISPLTTASVGPYTTMCNEFNANISSILDSMLTCSSILYLFTATPNGGMSPYTYEWVYDGIIYTDEFPSIVTSILNPTISVTITDVNGLISNETYLITTTESLSLTVSSSTPTCDPTDYLYAYAYPSGGSGNYSYLWSNGQTSQSLNSVFGGLTLGSYNVIITDNETGCSVSASVNLYNACYSISGTVYVDYNGNCIVDGNDYPLTSGYYVDLTGANATSEDYDYVYNAANGHYFIGDLSIGQYGSEISGYNMNSYSQNCATATVTVDVNNPNQTMDIFLTPPAPVQDLSVSLISITTFTPGFPYWASIGYCNDGTIPMSGAVVMNYDIDLDYIPGSSNPDVVDVANNLLTWNFVNLLPGQCGYLSPDFTTSVSAVLGSNMSNTVVVNPISGDVTPNNNSAYLLDTVTGSWDPNDKSVYPQGNITPDQKDHTYHINFQNKGNGPAVLVVVKDDLDDNLDIQTLRNVSASHNFVLTFENTDEMVFTFNNINLQAESVDEPNSKGHIDYTISQKEDLPLGTVIKNTAEIYFDFNEAVITNTTINIITVDKTTGIETLDVLPTIEVYPNPSNSLFNVNIEEGNNLQSIEVFDILGKLVFSASDLSGSKAIVNLSNTSNGMYVMKVSTENGPASKNIVISK